MHRFPPTSSTAKHLAALACLVAVLLSGGARFAFADDATAKIGALNKQALDAFDNLNFDQAKTLLEQAIDQGEAAGLSQEPVAARTHLNMGMLLIAGFQQRDQAVEHFKIALKIQPSISAPAGLFNPEVQAAFDEVKTAMRTEPAAPSSRATRPAGKSPQSAEGSANKEDGDGENEAEDSETASSAGPSRFMLSLGVGSGLGVAKGHLDANKDSVMDNSWSGGPSPSRLGHATLAFGMFLSPELLLSLEGRLQIVSGTTVVTGTPACNPSCSAPSTGIAVLAKASWFLSSGPLRPFVSGGIGVGTIRQVVKINVMTNAENPGQTGCGSKGTDPCVDTVTGGPVLLAVGGGLAYEIGSLALLGSLTANVGVPNVMLNIDAVLGLGVRL